MSTYHSHRFLFSSPSVRVSSSPSPSSNAPSASVETKMGGQRNNRVVYLHRHALRTRYSVHRGDCRRRRCDSGRRRRSNPNFLRSPDPHPSSFLDRVLGRGRFSLIISIIFVLFLRLPLSIHLYIPSSSSWPPPAASILAVGLTVERGGTSNLTPPILDPFSLFDNLTLHSLTLSLESSSGLRPHAPVVRRTVLNVRKGTGTGVSVTTRSFRSRIPVPHMRIHSYSDCTEDSTEPSR